jgi:hypothetical protein
MQNVYPGQTSSPLDAKILVAASKPLLEHIMQLQTNGNNQDKGSGSIKF